MRLLSFLPVALLFIIAHLAAANPAPNPLAEPLPIDDLIALSKRQQPAAFCPYENDCTCSQGAVGVYCYGCDEVRSAGRGTGDYRDWVFQCGKSYL